jgi:hypothetical protein
MGLEYWYLRRRIRQAESRIQSGLGDVQVRDEKLTPSELLTVVKDDAKMQPSELHTLVKPTELSAEEVS